RRVINITRQMQLLLGRIVMVAEKIVRLHDVNVTDLRRLQDFARTLGTRNVRACAHLAPPAERAAYPNLRPNSNDQWDADVNQPIRPQPETRWIIHVRN